MYEYHAKLVRVIDGDTVITNTDMGKSVWLFDDVWRLARINAPEMKGETREAGLQSRDELNRFLADRTLKIRSVKNRQGKEKKGSFARYLAEVYILVGETEFCVNDWMVAQNLAVYQDY